MGITIGVELGLRQAKIETPEQRRDGRRRVSPAVERLRGEPGIDEDQRDAAAGALDDQIRPKVGFGEQRQIGPPMLEEADDELRRVDGNKLMDDPRR